MRANSSIFSFRKAALQLAAVILFAATLLYAGRTLGGWYEEAAGKNKINEWSRQRFEDFYAMEPYSLNMLFVGSSHSYCTFDPEKIDTLMGVSSYQLGMPLQFPDSTYYTLLEALKTQHPDVVVMEAYWGVMDRDFDLKQADTLFQVLKDDGLKKDYIDNVFPRGEKVKYALKPVRFQQDFFAYKNKELLDWFEKEKGLKKTAAVKEGSEYYRSKGYIFCDYVMTEEERARTANEAEIDGGKWRMSSVQKEWMRKIARLCKDEGIRLVLVTAPVSNAEFSRINDYGRINAQVRAIADEFELSYLDFNEENRGGRLFPDDSFRDARHLNDGGAAIACNYFSEWMKN